MIIAVRDGFFTFPHKEGTFHEYFIVHNVKVAYDGLVYD